MLSQCVACILSVSQSVRAIEPSEIAKGETSTAIDFTAIPVDNNNELIDAVKKYFERARSIVGGESMLKRDEYTIESIHTPNGDIGYPALFKTTPAPDRPVAIVVIPSPASVRQFLDRERPPETEGGEGTKPLYEQPLDNLEKMGFNRGCAIYFSRTNRRKEKFNGRPVWPFPQPSPLSSNGDKSNISRYVSPNYLGKAVGGTLIFGVDFLNRIQLKTPVLAERETVELWPGVWLSELRLTGFTPQRHFVFPIADGNGGERSEAEMLARPVARSPCENLVECPGYRPTAMHQNLLIAPRPQNYQHIPWYIIEERIVLDEFFAGEAVPVALLCKAETWRPGKEDYRIEIGMKALDHRRADIRIVCVFTSIQPADLLELFARLAGREMDELSTSNETLRELRTLRAKANFE